LGDLALVFRAVRCYLRALETTPGVELESGNDGKRPPKVSTALVPRVDNGLAEMQSGR